MINQREFLVAGVVLIDVDGNMVCQLRDDIPSINDPGKAGIFGGHIESGESALGCALREINEETNLNLKANQLKPFMNYTAKRTLDDKPVNITLFIAKGIDTANLKTYEGQGFCVIKDPNDPRIAESVKLAFNKWFAERPKH
jgi:8-oxo-dGTP pyrophosphatase MutT (NUDIX family)